jgi:lipoate-protein ligase A
MERISGGRAALFSEGALSLTMTIPDAEPSASTEERFRTWSGLLRQSFADLGIDARIGAVPGEYCPGEYSVNAAGRIKLAGAGQRMIQGAAHVGFVILVTDSGLAREVLGPVYEALDLEYDGRTVGSLEDVVAGIRLDDAEKAILKRMSQHLAERSISLEPVALDPRTLAEAEKRAHRFRSPAQPE